MRLRTDIAMDNIDKELQQLIRELDLLDENDCLERFSMSKLRHICRYFYNLGKLDKDE